MFILGITRGEKGEPKAIKLNSDLGGEVTIKDLLRIQYHHQLEELLS